MHILGISQLGRESAVALVDERSILFAAEQEKLNRLQESPEVPRLAHDRCLKDMRLRVADLKTIAVASRAPGTHSSNRTARTEAEQQLLQLLRGGPRVTFEEDHVPGRRQTQCDVQGGEEIGEQRRVDVGHGPPSPSGTYTPP